MKTNRPLEPYKDFYSELHSQELSASQEARLEAAAREALASAASPNVEVTPFSCIWKSGFPAALETEYKPPRVSVDLTMIRRTSVETLRFVITHELAHLADSRIRPFVRFLVLVAFAASILFPTWLSADYQTLLRILFAVGLIAAASAWIEYTKLIRARVCIILLLSVATFFVVTDTNILLGIGVALLQFALFLIWRAFQRSREERADRAAATAFPDDAVAAIDEYVEYMRWMKAVVKPIAEAEFHKRYPKRAGQSLPNGFPTEGWLGTHPTDLQRRRAVRVAVGDNTYAG